MTVAPLLWIVPSRGRPDNIARLVDAWQATTSGVSDLLVCVDDDDPTIDGYLDLWAANARLTVANAPRSRLGPTLNAAALENADRYEALAFCGDDHLMRTPGLDGLWLDELRRLGTGMVYGDDLLQHDAFPTAVAMTSDIVRALGWMSPPGLIHLNVDLAWKRIGDALGCLSYLPDTVIEHVHPANGKAPLDAGYESVNSPEMVAADGATFARWVARDLDADVERVRAACGLGVAG